MATDTVPRSFTRQTLGILLLIRTPFWPRQRCRRLARILTVVCCLYVGVFLVLLALEDRILFSGTSAAHSWHEPPDALCVREVSIDSGDGERIHGWFSAPEGWQPQHGAVLYSHGKGNNLSRLGGRAYHWRQFLDRAILLYDYPGFGKSSGRPSEAGCYAAGEAALRWLIEEQQVPRDEVILVGESMGGAVATELATRHAVRLLVLHGAFTSFPDMAQLRVPCYPSRYLVRNRMENEAKIGSIHCPVLISHGTADTVVPYRHGERLFAAAVGPKLFVRREGQGHGLPTTADYFETVRMFLTETAR